MKQRAKIKIVSLVVTLLTLAVMPLQILAQGNFDASYILADKDLLDYNSFTLDQVKEFLNNKQSRLLYYLDPITGLPAPEIIYKAAQTYQVNPKYLLALLQKEQGLIESDGPTDKKFDWATGYALCDDCSMDDPMLLKYKGFYNQVIWSAKVIRDKYLPSLTETGRTPSGFGPGIRKRVDGQYVIPANNATAILYSYTPHIAGNELLWTIWNKYFSRSYPDGSLVNVEGKREVWLIKDGLRRKFASRAVYLSYYSNFDRVLTINNTELQKYPEGNIIKFAAYSFLKSPKGTVYLLLPGDIIRGFNSKKALQQIGVNPEEIIKIDQEDLAQFTEGTPITIKSKYPLGMLIQDKKSGGVYFVEDNIKHPIFSKEILKANFGSRKVTKKMTPKELEVFTTGDPLLFKEGDLVKTKNDNTIYVISNKKRRAIITDAAFLELGYSKKNVIVTTDQALALHELGDPIGEPF